MFSFEGITAVPESLIKKSNLQKAMLFELASARAEDLLRGIFSENWTEYLRLASIRQQKHYDAQIPTSLNEWDIKAAEHAAKNLVTILEIVKGQYPTTSLEHSPLIPGLGWIASGHGDFSLGSILIEVKHTEQNFRSGDFRQVLMYWLLRYARAVEKSSDVWSEVMLINPRRNAALIVSFNYLLKSASAQLNQI
ncbi:hypothetical protein [Methylobacterium sp. Leaf111]|uniref:hypothetical protein n=1 Tax=Methylobacterium sp. Leaf111 TaxID=1736257 RepID=UPI001FCD5BDC|nr:hypothetical protein [Methylobacterium sp. Leaf111]